MRIPLKYITKEIKEEYNIDIISDNGHVNVEIINGMHDLKEASILAFNYIVKNLVPFGYHPVRYTPGLCRHESRSTMFTLRVDGFGITYTPRKL